FFMNVMANVASNRSPDNTIYPILPDAGFDGIPEIKILWLTDFFDYVLLVFAFVLALTRPAPLLVVVKSVAAMLLTNLLRITTVAITSFPDPRPGCIKHSGNPFGNATLHRCGDCMFSGHTILYVISALIWFTYAPQGRFWRLGTFLMFCGAFAGGMIIIANRAHYTVDVLVAVYCTIGSFY
ncbi:MAG: PAP2 superfamily C-terminal-domain-containing protein, partial [Piptocephalis tieghemiana]